MSLRDAKRKKRRRKKGSSRRKPTKTSEPKGLNPWQIRRSLSNRRQNNKRNSINYVKRKTKKLCKKTRSRLKINRKSSRVRLESKDS